ncbi:hypothetical protein WJX81_004881 [Elliptochloris bilobata]|uniref:Uncharacterized protein n=1 Tax=Elliptochloris bilobata TaxID=381761 RepID=A0AAW1S5Z2_9CHLO
MSDPLIEGEPLQFLKLSEAYWTAMRNAPVQRSPPVVRVRHRRLQAALDCDVAVCGGTLGLFIALALQLRGHHVTMVEKRRVEGRSQEWNVSRQDLDVLLDEGLLTPEELESAVATQIDSSRVSFLGGREIWVKGVLDLGVNPRALIKIMKARFLDSGGTILEDTAFRSAEVYPEGVAIRLSAGGAGGGRRAAAAAAGGEQELHCRLLIDCMGHWSPIVKQMRGGRKPEGICMVCGSCAEGVPAEQNRTGDFLHTFTDASDDMQLFWEAFPAEGGAARTTYMFTYCDTDKRRPSFQALLDRYFELLPQYQGVPLEALRFRRVLFGAFPTYASSPLRPQFDRILQVGDASASQSPLSFGGFGSMLRHLPRLAAGVDSALAADALSQRALAVLQPYQPSLSAAWLFQRSMALLMGQLRGARGRRGAVSGFLPPDHVNRLLGANFRVMQALGDRVLRPFLQARCALALGDRVLRPFLQDTVRWWPLTATMAGTLLAAPVTIARVLAQVGPHVVLGWLGHYWALAAYTLLDAVARPLRGVKFLQGHRVQRCMDAWRWGAGQDTAHAAAPA